MEQILCLVIAASFVYGLGHFVLKLEAYGRKNGLLHTDNDEEGI